MIKHNLGAFMYAGGSAGTNSTYRANRQAFEKYGIIPRMLVNATTRSLEVRRKTNWSIALPDIDMRLIIFRPKSLVSLILHPCSLPR